MSNINYTDRRGFISYAGAATIASMVSTWTAQKADGALNEECLDTELPFAPANQKRERERAVLRESLSFDSALSGALYAPPVTIPTDLVLSSVLEDSSQMNDGKMLATRAFVMIAMPFAAFALPQFRNNQKMNRIVAKAAPNQQQAVKNRLRAEQLLSGASWMLPVLLTSIFTSGLANWKKILMQRKVLLSDIEPESE